MAAAVRHLFLCDAMYEVIDQIMSRAGMPSTIPAAYCVMGKRVVDSQIRDIGGGASQKALAALSCFRFGLLFEGGCETDGNPFVPADIR